jgi:ubiquinone/menaquinone biosynthesis C-methylase UbiE
VILRLLHKLVAHPRVFDLVQNLVGGAPVAARLREHCRAIPPGALVLDLAGGTGSARQYLPAECRYVCLDNELPKLTGFRAKDAGGNAILGDCTAVPLRDGSVDAVLCIAMSHHLTDEQLCSFWNEAARVLKPDGRFLFFDPVYAPGRLAGRLLWRLDRGAHPRSAGVLLRHLDSCFQVLHHEEFAVYHQYFLASGRPTRP